MSQPNRAGKALGGCFMGFWLLFWCGITFTFDCLIGYALYQQCRAYTFAETTGTITKSRIATQHDSDGSSSKLEVEYRFTVEGREHTGNRYRHSMVSTNDRTWQRIQKQLTVGTTVPVFYDARDPNDCLLVRGPMGMDLFLIWFLTPFNVIGIGGILYALGILSEKFRPDDRRVIVMTDTGWQYRPDGRGWWPLFGVSLLGVTFIGIFLIGFTLGFNPPLIGMALAWAIAILISVIVACRVSRRVAVEFNDFEKTISLFPRKAPSQAISFANFNGFLVDVEEKVDSDGDKTTKYHLAYGPTIRLHDWSDRETADAVVTWLNAAITAMK